MNKTLSKTIFEGIPVGLLISVFLYILFILQPELIFHHAQPAFILSTHFFYPFLKYPGGLAELFANLLMQSFYFKIAGTFLFFALAFCIGWITCALINSIYKSKLNHIWAFIPVVFTITLANNYNLQFSIIVSVAFILLMLLILQKFGKGIFSSLLLFAFGGVAVYWFAGSGYLLLFSISALFISEQPKFWGKAVYLLFIPAFTFLFLLLMSNYVVAVAQKYKYFYFFAQKAWFMRYEPSIIFILFLGSVPILLAVAKSIAFIQTKIKKADEPKPILIIIKASFAMLFVLVVSVFSHFATFNSDAKKIVLSDYYCYKNKPEETAKTATSLRAYDFSANLNYNLVMSKTGRLNENYFGFMQLKGTEALHPDIEFASELSFISSDFYYNLGFISESRHWAYESLVFYPYSLRAMQSLVKIHLVCGEYKAAERVLNTLAKGLIDKKFVREYMPYVKDTTLVASNTVLMEKRSYIPRERELNPSIDGRFRELLEANGKNKKAYEFLMLYYLANAKLEEFAELCKNVGMYFDKTPAIYEEALLMYSASSGYQLPSEIKISAETQTRYNNFVQQLEKYKGKTRQARNELYMEYGKTYLYFLTFVYPNILETEIITDEDDYPAI